MHLNVNSPDGSPFNSATAELRALEELNLRLPAGLPVFEPTKRQAILVNSYDELQFLAQRGRFSFDGAAFEELSGPREAAEDLSNPRWMIASGHSRGSEHICSLEALLGGRGVTTSETLCPSDSRLRPYLEKNFAGFGKRYDPAFHYDVEKLQSLDNLSWDETKSAIARCALNSDAKTLTFFYVVSHGEFGSIYIGDELVPYSEILANLDRIAGKKVLVLLACYSGSIFHTINERRRNLEDLVVLTSSRGEQRSTNWSCDSYDIQLWNQITSRTLLSNLQLKPLYDGSGRERDLPRTAGGFDVTL